MRYNNRPNFEKIGDSEPFNQDRAIVVEIMRYMKALLMSRPDIIVKCFSDLITVRDSSNGYSTEI